MLKFKTGDFVIYDGPFRFPGEVIRVAPDGYCTVKAIGDSEGNYAGIVKVFLPGQLKLWNLGATMTGPALLVIDPELDAVAQVRAWCDKNLDTQGLGAAQLRAFLKFIDTKEPDPAKLINTLQKSAPA